MRVGLGERAGGRGRRWAAARQAPSERLRLRPQSPGSAARPVSHGCIRSSDASSSSSPPPVGSGQVGAPSARRQRHHEDGGREQRDQHRPHGGAAARGEQHGQRDDRREVRERAGHDHHPAGGRPDLPGVAQHGHDQPERCRGERHHQQRRRADPPDGGEDDRDGHRQGDRQGVPRHREAEPRAGRAGGVDLQTGEEQQERQAQPGQHGDRGVDADPAEHGRADDDPGADLQYHGRHAQPRDEPSRSGTAAATRQTRNRFSNDSRPRPAGRCVRPWP